VGNPTVDKILGSSICTFKELSLWAKLPKGCDFKEVADVAVDSADLVYVFNRGVHPIVVFEADGTFVKAWGRGMFTRPHEGGR
jgi:hypothetical protein